MNDTEFITLIKTAKENNSKRKFKQSVEMIIVLKDIEVKKGFTINEIVQLPKLTKSSVCVLAAGDIGLKAKNAKADNVVDNEELIKIGSNKRQVRKFINKYDFFLADIKLMPTIGKILGQFLGPRGKMPIPIQFDTQIENILEKFRASIKVKTRGSVSIACKIGDESMTDNDLMLNANAVINNIEKKLPNGNKNIKKIFVKTTMGKITGNKNARK